MNKKYGIYMLIAVTLLSVIFNYFFLYTHWGISVLLFNILLLAVSYFALKKHPNFNLIRFFIISLFIVILSIPFFLYDFILFKFLNSFIIVLIYGYMFSGYFKFNLLSIISSTFKGVFNPLFKLHCYLRDVSSCVLKKSSKLKRALLGLLFAGLTFIIILPLLLSSDSVFQSGFDHIFNFIDIKNINEIIMRGIAFLFIASFIYSAFLHSPNPAAENQDEKIKKHFDSLVSNVFLICIDGVYLIYSFVQVKYLFMGNILPDGMNYSEYARQGFFQLVFVTIINVIIVLIFNCFKTNKLITNLLLTITVICTYIMTFSAFFRMNLYETTYGYTRLRLLVYLFIIAEILALIPILIGIFKINFKYLEYAFMKVFIFYVIINFINIDGFVAKENVNRYLTYGFTLTGDFDIKYLDELSNDALPEIDLLIQKSDEETANYFKETVLIKYRDYFYSTKWFEYNHSIEKTYDYYKKYYPNGFDKNSSLHYHRNYYY